jgi:hypothetical protein
MHASLQTSLRWGVAWGCCIGVLHVGVLHQSNLTRMVVESIVAHVRPLG